jgi:hypothetical protein
MFRDGVWIFCVDTRRKGGAMNKVLMWFPCGVGLAALTACGGLVALPPDPGNSSPPLSVESPRKSPRRSDPAAVAAASMPQRSAAADAQISSLQLIGLNGEALRDRLGRPSEELEQGPGKLWRFRYAGNCTLDVRLYPDVQTQTFRSLNYEVTGDDGSDNGKRRCAAELQSWANRN